jgi:hypothetical protein
VVVPALGRRPLIIGRRHTSAGRYDPGDTTVVRLWIVCARRVGHTTSMVGAQPALHAAQSELNVSWPVLA